MAIGSDFTPLQTIYYQSKNSSEAQKREDIKIFNPGHSNRSEQEHKIKTVCTGIFILNRMGYI